MILWSFAKLREGLQSPCSRDGSGAKSPSDARIARCQMMSVVAV